MFSARHGDVVIQQVEVIDGQALTPIPRSNGMVVLAEGEVTGHGHRIRSRSASLYGIDGRPGVKLCRVGAGGAVLRHEEHGPIKLPPGDYEVTIKRQWSPDGWRDVRD